MSEAVDLPIGSQGSVDPRLGQRLVPGPGGPNVAELADRLPALEAGIGDANRGLSRTGAAAFEAIKKPHAEVSVRTCRKGEEGRRRIGNGRGQRMRDAGAQRIRASHNYPVKSRMRIASAISLTLPLRP